MPGSPRFVLLAVLVAGLAVGSTGCGPEPAPDGGPVDGADDPSGTTAITDEEMERLMALGYLDFVEDGGPELAAGATVLDPDRVAPGLTLFSVARGCTAMLIEMDGSVVNRWELSECYRWENAVLRPDGRLLATSARPPRPDGSGATHRRFIAELAWDGSVRWRRELRTHHDADLLPDGRIAVLIWGRRRDPRVHPHREVQDNGIAILDSEGRLLERVWLLDLLLADGERMSVDLDLRQRETRDLLHANSVEWMRPGPLRQRHPLYDDDHVLVVFRNLDSVAIIDWSERRLVWSWGPGELSRPHDATLLENGNILVFDNGVAQEASRVVELDPVGERIVWQYRAAEPRGFYTRTRGAAQRLANGNTLVTSSNQGWIFEVTPDGEIVWEYRVPADGEGRRPALVRARRVRRADADGQLFERSD